MDTAEKTFLLQLLMMDIRMSWDAPTPGALRDDQRAHRALVIAAELWDDYFDSIDWTELFSMLAMYLSGRWEGSLLKAPCTAGGYEGMEDLHGLPFTLAGRSDEFLAEVKKYIRTEYSWENPNVSL